mmetsp:Transcript_7059/g.10559  ORF Transcript_7059/g.10559 Transcript_7059/m.10559 type:complete len:386 (-) Transcript_7059:192-1349(-)
MDTINAIVSYFEHPSNYIQYISSPEYITLDLPHIDAMAAEGHFTKLSQLYPSLFYCLALSLCRLVLQQILFKPLAIYALKLDAVDIKVHKDIAARVKSSKTRLSKQEIESISKQSGMSIEEVNDEIWSRRRSLVQNKKMVKFIEASWRFIFYTAFCIMGYYTLFVPTPVPWVLRTEDHWTGWPMQPVYPMVKYYYLVELGAYFHQLLWTDVSRSDSLEMIIHHIVTIFLIVLSYLCNFTRIGTTVLILHDPSDVFLESAKVVNYVSKVKGREYWSHLCDVLFAIFAISFFVLRLVIYPYWVFYSSYVVVEGSMGSNWTGFWIYFGLLMALQLLHVFWFYLISKMIYRLLTTGIEKDERSDDDDDDIDGPNAETSESQIKESKKAQ